MLKKNLLNLLLLIIVITLIYLVIHTKPENNRLDTLTHIQPETIKQIIIRHHGHTSKLIKRTEGKQTFWQFTQPINIAANNFRIKALLALLNAPVDAQYKTIKMNLQTIGLAHADTSIEFNQQRIQFGIINPLNGLRYILYHNRVYLIQDVFFPLINSNFSTLVALELLPHNSHIRKLVLPGQRIFKTAKGLWKSTLKQPTDAIINTLQQWQNIQAFGVHQYLPRASQGTIQVFLDTEKKPLIFQITSTRPWVILARPALHLEYHLDKKNSQQLFKPVAQY